MLLRAPVASAFLDVSPLQSSSTSVLGDGTVREDREDKASTFKEALEALKDKEFFTLPFQQKVALLSALLQFSFETGLIAQEIRSRTEQRAELMNTRREEEQVWL